MATEVTMPALSPTMEEGTLAKWLVQAGDAVSQGQVIAEIETDKATMELEAPAAGVLARIVTAEGGKPVPVGALLAWVAAVGEVLPAAGVPAPVAQTAAPAEAAAATPATTAVPTASHRDGGRVFASPLARRIAKDARVNLTVIKGSGPHGRILKSDVEAAARQAPVAATTAQGAAVAPVAAAVAAPAIPAPSDRYDVVPLDNLRKTIARRLTESKQTVPHFYLRTDICLDALLALRAQLNASAPAGTWKLSVNDMVVKALALALKEVPEANVSWADGVMLQHRHVDVSVAVAIEGGLITPVVADAEMKSLSTISTEIRDLALRARARKLRPEEYQGGTTSISNLGMFGVTSFDAVINPPQATILAVGAGEKRSIVRNDAMVIATMMSVTLSVDHRVVDGAIGARVLAAIKRKIEQPLLLLV